MYRIIYYSNARGDSPVEEFLDTLDRKAFKKVVTFILYLAEQGPDLHRPYSDHIRGPARVTRPVRWQFGEGPLLLHGWTYDRSIARFLEEGAGVAANRH